MKQTTPRDDFLRGVWRENPVLVQMLGLCPALAVTNTVALIVQIFLTSFVMRKFGVGFALLILLLLQ